MKKADGKNAKVIDQDGKIVERDDLARAGDIDLGLSGASTLAERGRLWAHKQLAKAQDDVLAAKLKLQETAKAFLRSQVELSEEIERNRKWHQNIDTIRAKIQDEYDAEDRALEIRRLEREVALAEAKMKAAEAAAREEEAHERIEEEKVRREARRQAEANPKPKRTAEDAFLEEAEQILKYGVSGKYMAMAEKLRQEIIAERGGEEHLTDEDKARIETLFQLARRKQESKS